MYVYKHTNLTNNKVYIGITQQEPIMRWQENGTGYSTNKKFMKDIKQYGWNKGFSHEVLFFDLSDEEAIIKETELILKYDSVETGYNGSYCSDFSYLPEYLKEEVDKKQEIRQQRYNEQHKTRGKTHFDFYDFKPIKNKQYEYKTDNEYFTKVPNWLIRNNIKKKYGVSYMLPVIFIMIDKHRSLDNTSYICISEVLEKCGYQINSRKAKIFYEISKCLLFLNNSNFIQLNEEDVIDANYKDCLRMNIIYENFDTQKDFTKILWNEFDSILSIRGSQSCEQILISYLYIKSYIGTRKENIKNPEKYPNAFWRSVESMAKELSVSKETITRCIEQLTLETDSRQSLLVKKEVGSIKIDKNKPPKNIPNIYVLNKNGYLQEIEWAMEKVLSEYSDYDIEEIKGGKPNKN